MDQDKSSKYHIEMDESTPFVELMFEATVPISAIVPIVKHDGLTLSTCSLIFEAGGANSTENATDSTMLRLRAVPTAGRNSRILWLKFAKIESEDSLIDGFRIDKIRVHYYIYP